MGKLVSLLILLNTSKLFWLSVSIEQVIEKEIGKGAEIISSKEVAITNNVDYYENEEELETTQSRSRR
ncbi:hypothetical protein MM0349_10080 [Helicobacter pylori]